MGRTRNNLRAFWANKNAKALITLKSYSSTTLKKKDNEPQ
jgi:hypothetical protein